MKHLSNAEFIYEQLKEPPATERVTYAIMPRKVAEDLGIRLPELLESYGFKLPAKEDE